MCLLLILGIFLFFFQFIFLTCSPPPPPAGVHLQHKIRQKDDHETVSRQESL
jgi:hypothetical protein